jgi:hypothetical protein
MAMVWGGMMLVFLCGCGENRTSKSVLTDAQFVDLCVTVYGLYGAYCHQPDSLKIYRQAVFDRYGITPAMVQEFIDQHQRDPDSWVPIVFALRERLGETAEVKLEAFGATSGTQADSTKRGP